MHVRVSTVCVCSYGSTEIVTLAYGGGGGGAIDPLICSVAMSLYDIIILQVSRLRRTFPSNDPHILNVIS